MAAQRGWFYSSKSGPKPKVPEQLRTTVQEAAQKLIDEKLKPEHIKPPAKDQQWNYLIDIYSKWHRSFFYLFG